MKITKETKLAEMTVNELLTVMNHFRIAHESHTSGGICRWGDYPKHFDYCETNNCPWLQAKAFMKGLQ